MPNDFQKFTVFSDHGFQPNCGGADQFEGATLQQMLDGLVTDYGMEPVAWAPEGVMFYGGVKGVDDLRRESIAAGRLIELVNGEWVARGYEEAKPAKSIGKLLREKAEADAQAYYASKTPTLDKLENTTERQRPRLTWDAPVRIDRFPGFTVKSDTTEVEAFPHPLARSPDLEQSSHLMDPRYALAANKA